MKNQNSGIRWDKVFGLLTLIAIAILAIMVYADYRPARKTTSSENIEEKTQQETLETVSSKVTVCIDAGHGGKDTGAYFNGVYEKTQTLDMAVKVKNVLEKQNVNVVMTRTSDVDVSDEDRTRMCNDAASVAMISIHRNSYEGTANVYGAEMWIHSSAPSNSENLASGILKKLKSEVDEDSRGVKYGTISDFTADYYINVKSKCASCVLELGYMTSPLDSELVTTKADDTAKAIADGILQYLKTMGYMNE